MPNRVENPFAEISTGFVNTVNDVVAGGTEDLTNQAHYAGVLGQRIWLDGSSAGVKFNSTIGTVYGGAFQYVKLYASASQAARVGQPLAWAYDQDSSCFEDYTVTTDTNSALRTGRIAGICLNATWTAGQYAWIQTKGKVKVLFRSAITKATPADGDLVIVDSGTGLADTLDSATAILSPTLKAMIGTTLGAATSNQLNLVLLRALADVV